MLMMKSIFTFFGVDEGEKYEKYFYTDEIKNIRIFLYIFFPYRFKYPFALKERNNVYFNSVHFFTSIWNIQTH